MNTHIKVLSKIHIIHIGGTTCFQKMPQKSAKIGKISKKSAKIQQKSAKSAKNRQKSPKIGKKSPKSPKIAQKGSFSFNYYITPKMTPDVSKKWSVSGSHHQEILKLKIILTIDYAPFHPNQKKIIKYFPPLTMLPTSLNISL